MPELSRLRADIGTEVLALPGVLRIEPTLVSAVRGFGKPRDPSQHLHLFQRDIRVDATVHVAVSAKRQTRAIAHELYTVVGDTIARHGWRRGVIEICILSIEPQE